MREDKEVFVSRHGRRTNLGDVNLGELNIEEQPKPMAVTSQPKAPAAKPKIVFPRPQRKPLSKKTWIIIGGAILVVVLVPLLTLEVVALQYSRNAYAISVDVSRIAKSTALPEQKKTQLSENAIAKTVTQLSAVRDRSCKGGMLDNIAKLYPRAASALQRCSEANGQLSDLINSLTTLQNIQAYDLAVDAVLKPALAAADSPYAVLPDQVSSWQSTRDKLKAINAPNELKTFHVSLTQVVTDIASQWSAINSASNAQDAAGFKDAESKLGSFYESLRDLSPTLIEIQQKVQADVTSAQSNTR